MLPERIRSYLRAHREAHVQALCELIRLPSIANVAPGPGGEDACEDAAAWLIERLGGLGFDARRLDGPTKPFVIAHGRSSQADAPTVLVYGHYDVQPADPVALWNQPDPFEPVIRDGRIYARGANDDKGQLFAHLMALEAWQQAGGGLPVNVTVLIEGEEEIGSPGLEPFIRRHQDELAADYCVLSDSEFFAPGVPAITYGLRGLAYVELTVHGPSADLHSGLHGGAVANPANVLCRLVADLHDNAGRVTVPGFYDDVAPLTEAERAEWDRLPFDEPAYARSLGVDALTGGERDRPVLERRWARPTLDCNGLVGGYTSPGAKTIIPASATAKLSMRLVAHQDPDKIIAALEDHLARAMPEGVRWTLTPQSTARPVLIQPDSPAIRAGQEAFAEGFGQAAALTRCGASVPITELFQRVLGLDAVLLGFGLPDDNLHSPNEKFDLAQLHGGAVTAAAMLARLGELPRG